METKSFDVECKALDDENGTVEFYAAVFGNVDRVGDVIEPGAFKNLDAFKREGWIAIDHDWKRLGVATIEDATQDEKGLKIRAHFHSTPEAQSVRTTIRERMSRGKSVKASIGYKTIESTPKMIEGKSVRALKSVDIFEASIVNMPVNPRAETISIKSDKFMGMDDARGLLAEFKAGRVISSANEAALRRFITEARGFATWADEAENWLNERVPAKPSENPASMPDPTPADSAKSVIEATELYHEFMALCANFDA